MAISTIDKGKETVVDKKENLKKLREFHKATLDKIGVPVEHLTGKMAYRPYGKAEIFVSFFDNEINKGHDIFLEFTNRDYIPEDVNRILYMWKFNPHFEEEYDKTDVTTGNSNFRYLIPVDELIIIKNYSEKSIIAPEPVNTFDLPDPSIDPPINELTIRDLAAIFLNKPVSNKKWLNEIIKQK